MTGHHGSDNYDVLIVHRPHPTIWCRDDEVKRAILARVSNPRPLTRDVRYSSLHLGHGYPIMVADDLEHWQRLNREAENVINGEQA